MYESKCSTNFNKYLLKFYFEWNIYRIIIFFLISTVFKSDKRNLEENLEGFKNLNTEMF